MLARLTGFLLAVGLAVALMPGVAIAQNCSVSATDISFGNVDVLSNEPTESSGSISVHCSGQAHEIVRVCLSVGYPNGSQSSAPYRVAIGGGADVLNFQLYSDPGLRMVLGSWQYGGFGGLEVDIPLNADGAAAPVQRMVYGRVFPWQSRTEPSTYMAVFNSLNTLATVQYARGIPCSALVSGAQRFPFTVSARVMARCSVTAGLMDFGVRSSLETAIDASTNLGITCSRGLPFQIFIDGGMNAGAYGADRAMSNGADAIRYRLYKDFSRLQSWGENLGFDTHSGQGTGLTQAVPVFGRVLPQPTPRPGIYTDTVVVTVQY